MKLRDLLRWIPISERLPKKNDSEYVALYSPSMANDPECPMIPVTVAKAEWVRVYAAEYGYEYWHVLPEYPSDLSD